MPQRPASLMWLAGLAAVALSACSGTTAPSPTATPSASGTADPTPTPTPLPPDTMTVGVLAVGIGTFDLAAIPVAELKNDAKFHGAAAVVVHFVTSRAGRTLGSLESASVNLAPGETLAVTGTAPMPATAPRASPSP